MSRLRAPVRLPRHSDTLVQRMFIDEESLSFSRCIVDSDVHAIIFVVDSTDRIRLCVAKEELDEVLRHNEARAGQRMAQFFTVVSTDRRILISTTYLL